MGYLQYVNPLMGTNSVKTYSNGNVSPIVALPFGANHYTIETRPDSDFLFFNPNDHTTTGLRLTHQLSPWLGDYGAITMLPTSEDAVDFHATRSSSYLLKKCLKSPSFFKVYFMRYRSEMSLAPTMHGARGSLRYSAHFPAKRLFLNLWKGGSQIKIDTQNNTVSGYVTNKILDHSLPKNFKEYFVMKFGAAINLNKTVALVSGEEDFGKDFYSGNDVKISLSFDTEKTEISYALATSYISFEQAEKNLEREIGTKNEWAILQAAEDKWNEKLAKIEIETENDEQKQIFYTCLYRTYLFPHTFHEIDENGEKIHYSPSNGEVLAGPLYTDMGFWDVYRTSLPLLTILEPELYADICKGLLNFYKESGWLPRFSAPGPISCMPGTAVDMVFADAVKKGIITDQKDIELMLEGMLKHANTPCENPKLGGRDGVLDYCKLGYVPFEYRESVNKTIDYSYGDWCIAIIADYLGKTELSAEYKRRALNYKNIFDSKTNLLRAKDANGDTRTDFREFEWGFDYTEGSAWQNSFSVFHDMAGHAALMGGKDQMIKMIDKLFALPPIFEVGYRKKETHEMSEMAAVNFGQCALSNQPSFHIPYIYSYMGEMDKTCFQVRRAVNELFSNTVDGYPGDEDTGSMSAWYIFSVLGFYPVTPGSGEYVLTSPSVKSALIHTGFGTHFKVDTENFSKANIYISEIAENGANLSATYIDHQTVANGGNIKFTLTDMPKGKTESNTPFSLSK